MGLPCALRENNKKFLFLSEKAHLRNSVAIALIDTVLAQIHSNNLLHNRYHPCLFQLAPLPIFLFHEEIEILLKLVAKAIRS